MGGTSTRRATRAARWLCSFLGLLAAIALGGCGGANTSTNGLAPAPVSVSFTSSAIHGDKLPALYTCDGKNIAPPVSWGNVPSGVEELALFALGTRTNKLGQTALSIEWAMAGVQPALHHLNAGEIPHGAFLESDSTGQQRYSICPKKGETKRYSFVLYALPRGSRASRGFPGPNLFRNLTTVTAGLETQVNGAFPAHYTRR
jgi:phosphatidylethanolamine-binding protein (PEBP) family uncharacterized protein